MNAPTPPSAVETFWQSYLRSLPQDAAVRTRPMPAAWGFGTGKEMAEELGRLVLQGTKTATCSLLWEYESGNEPLPRIGTLGIVLDGRDAPLCLIETIDVEIRPFNEVDAGFAHAEGEGDRTLATWREVHWRFFTDLCRTLGKTPTETMPLVCERFRVLWRAS